MRLDSPAAPRGSAAPASLGAPAPAPAQAQVAVAEALPSSEPGWRLEISRKIEDYRVRTGRLPAREPQRPLPFPEHAATQARLDSPAKSRSGPRRPERLRIFVEQPGLEFPSDSIPSPNHALVPVAPILRRAFAWLIDIGILGACWIVFLGLIRLLGVEIAASKLALGICLAILFLLYAQYFGLFTAFGGITPGMRIAGLRVVSFDGNPPTPHQLLWRSLGYLVSGGAALLGFLWALWDEDRLCWQDRASQTYLTALPAVPEQQPAEARR